MKVCQHHSRALTVLIDKCKAKTLAAPDPSLSKREPAWTEKVFHATKTLRCKLMPHG
jgi:hypothetical protein